MFKVIVAGSRGFNDYPLLSSYLDLVFSKTGDDIEIVCGMARGADTLGEQYARERDYSVAYFPAEWEKYGKSAGYKRNSQMADYADALVAFWDGNSRGTKHMIDLARSKNLKVRIKYYEQEN